MRILVTGGAGYVGSFTTRHLLEQGHEVVVIDDLREGHPAALPPGILQAGDVGDRSLLERLMREQQSEAVMHFAGSTRVAESVADPGLHYRNNTVATLGLLEAMGACGVKRIVFSSTAATYGAAEQMPLREDAPQRPVCAYGSSKLAIEWMIEDFARAHRLSYAVLRYFNAAGAAADGSHGEDHHPESHLIPLVIAAALGRRPGLDVYGDDYDTPDGTCLRDYVHVEDLARAHELVLEAAPDPERGGGGRAYNVGTGRGHTVLEVIRAVERAGGAKVPYRVAPRRAGDPAALVASAERLRGELGWTPRYVDLDALVATAWAWHSAHPDGYADERPAAGETAP